MSVHTPTVKLAVSGDDMPVVGMVSADTLRFYSPIQLTPSMLSTGYVEGAQGCLR
jgi:hypothetical protein